MAEIQDMNPPSNKTQRDNSYKKLMNKIKPDICAFVFDFDGTIKSSTEPDCHPLELIKKIILKDKHVGIVTASGVSALKGLAQQITELSKKNKFSTPVYLGIANGTALYKLDGKNTHELYKYPLNLNDINKILQAWKEVMEKINLRDSDLVGKGLTIFNEFLKRDWSGRIPKKVLNLMAKYPGKCFGEDLKVTFVMPQNNVYSQENFVQLIQENLDKIFGPKKFIIDMGDSIFAHVTRWPGMAPKMYALMKIKEELGLKENQLVVFGDMPFGNDKGMLIDSKLPYTFTNKYHKKIKNPPFILPNYESAPVLSVYKAVDSLL